LYPEGLIQVVESGEPAVVLHVCALAHGHHQSHDRGGMRGQLHIIAPYERPEEAQHAGREVPPLESYRNVIHVLFSSCTCGPLGPGRLPFIRALVTVLRFIQDEEAFVGRTCGHMRRPNRATW
jgi:hypothetical protein